MKNFYTIPRLLLVTLFMGFGISTFGQTALLENFDGGALPTNWVTNGKTDGSGTKKWLFVKTNGNCTTADHTSGTGYYALSDSYNVMTSESPVNLITPTIDLSADAFQLEFYAWVGGTAPTDPILVDISTNDGSTWNSAIYTVTKAITGSWVKHSINIASYNTTTVKIRFRGIGNYGSGFNNSGIDDIKVFVPVIPNGTPTTFSATAVTKTGMTVNWVDNSTNETGFRVYKSADNITFTQFGADIPSTSVATTGTAYVLPITGLTFSTTYYYKIVAYTEGETAPLLGNQATVAGDPADAAPTTITFTSIGLTKMTVGWTDNSTNETSFRVYKATDIAGPYTQVGSDIASTTSVGIGTTYSLVLTGLNNSTTYYFRIAAVLETESSYLTGSQATNVPSPMSGKYTVGFDASYNYHTLTAAFADITVNGFAGPIQLELQLDYDAYEEPAFPIVPSKNATAVNTLTIFPKESGTVINAGSQGLGLFNFDGVNYVTFDGRVGGSGSVADLVIKQPGTSNFVIQFINDATNNNIKYCLVQGGCTTNTIGLINFAGTTGTTGNDNNLIDYCEIKPAVTSYTTGIYSSGNTTTGKENSGNTISNSKIYNFYNLSSGSSDYGIFLSSGSTNWTITGNSFYQTATRNYSASATHIAINIASSLGNGFIVTNNNIGGSAPLCAGVSPWTISYSTTAYANRFVGIKLSVGSTTPSTIQGNTIANFSFKSNSSSTTAGGPWCGIYLTAGNATINNNTIGNGTSTGSIISTVEANSGGISTGIFVDALSNTSSITNNTIGSINTIGLTATVSHGFTGIVTTSGTTLTISNNAIGSASTANSINAINAATGGTAQVVTGVNNSSSATISISNNTIANLNNAYSPIAANSNPIIRGIISSNGATTISGNTIRNLSTAANATGTSGSASVIGISLTSTTAPAVVTQNNIYSISNNNTSANAVLVTGIFYNGPTTGTNLVERNLIYGLNSTSTSESTTLSGIQINGGTTTFQNNIISLGSGVSVGYAINGIYENLGTNNVYFNSVYIGGTATTSGQKTFAFYGNQTFTTRSFRNNLFVNARSTSAGTGKNYAVKVGGSGVNPTGLTCDYNIYQTTGTAGIFGFFNSADVADLAAWQTAVGQDLHSLNIDPKYVDPSNATPDLHLQGGSPADMIGIDIPAITNDFFGDLRSSLTPTDIGADAGNFDNVAPTVIMIPATGATGVSLGANATLTFSENVRKVDNSAIDASVIIFQNTSDVVAVPFSIDYTNKVLTVTPNSPLSALKNYTVTVSGIEDFNDNALTGSNSTSFTTEVGDIIAPTYTSSSVENADPSKVVVLFSENVKLTSAAGFIIKVDGSAVTINSYSGNNTSTLTFVLTAPITSHQLVTIEYAQAVGNVTDITGNSLANVAATSVTNNTKSNSKEFLTFNLLKSDNSALTSDVIGVIASNTIDLYVPIATDVTGLKACFTTSAYSQMVEIGATQQASGVTVNNFSTTIIYKVTAEDNTTKDFMVSVHQIYSTPYVQTFDDVSFPPTEWSVVNAGTGYIWSRSGTAQSGAGSMYYYAHSTNAANTWAFAPALDLVTGKKYVIEFWQKTSGWAEKLKVTVGNGPHESFQTTEIWKNENLTNTNWNKIKETYTCPASGYYNFAFNCYSDANRWNLYIDEVVIREISNNAQLATLKVGGTTVAGFSADTYTYNVELAYGATLVPQITEANPTDVNALKVITQAISLTGTAAERTAKVLVTAEDGIATQTYSVVFTIAKSNIATLSDLKVDGTTLTGFAAPTYTYNVTLPYGTIIIPQITEATLTDVNASKIITQAVNITGSIAERTAKVLVTAEDGTSTHTYSVIFAVAAPTTYAVNFSAVGANGTLAATVDASAIATGALVIQGKNVIFTASPANGYRVKEWQNNTVVITGNTSNTYTLTNLTAAATVTVEYEVIPPTTYAVNFSVVGANGTLAVTVDASAITTGALVVQGKNVVFSASPASGYRVKEWKNNTVVVTGNTSNTYTLTNLTAVATITVEFEAIPPTTYAVNFSVVGTNGTLAATVDASTISTGALVIQGKNVVFTASPASGYKVKEWKMNSAIISGNSTNTYTLSNLTATATISIEFEVATGIGNLTKNKVSLYPNPFTSFIKVSNVTDLAQVQITSITGQLLGTYNSNSEEILTINTDNLQNGVYIIRMVDSRGKIRTQKMVKN